MTTAQKPVSLPKADRWANFWHSPGIRKLRRNPLALSGLAIMLLFLLMAIFAPLIAKPSGNCLRDLNMTSANQVYNPLGAPFWKAVLAPPQSCYKMERLSFSQEPSPPSQQAIFGTVNGYNIFYGLIWGTRTALKMSFIIVGITLLVGIIIGAISGYYGGWVDNAIQRLIDVIFAMPGLVLTVVILTIMRANNPGGDPTLPIIVAYTVAGWAAYARFIRGDVLKTRKLEYVDAARGLGASDWRQIAKHVIPNSLTTVFTLAVLDLATVPLGVAALSFLGLGFEPGFSEWGQLVDFSRQWLKPAYWYTLTFPVVFILLFSLAFNLFGSGLRDALDPRTR
ncbi:MULTISPECIES: ABC transporter permease [Deinococcus]|uniref:ABC transporter permease n=1 Tax=Deinococcus cavernae TaxID=2320857 RepID=A0A418V6N9_9DEIO|nr:MULTISPECIES: ABC transporter permease [Deinococcus]RJF71783.1 ABC transporter permease [Deinococcus cavernae]